MSEAVRSAGDDSMEMILGGWLRANELETDDIVTLGDGTDVTNTRVEDRELRVGLEPHAMNGVDR